MRAVLDTSVFIAREQGRPIGRLPEEVAVSVVTLAELRHGVLGAVGQEQLSRRLTTLEVARDIGRPLGIDESVGNALARLRVSLRAAGRSMRVMDAWIAATAMANDAAVGTQDADFDAADALGLLRVTRI